MSEFDLRRFISSPRIRGLERNRSRTSIIIRVRASHTARGNSRRGGASLSIDWIGFEPGLLLVSAGFDAYARDPLLRLTLEREDFATFGEWLCKIDTPIAVALEGGYSNELPELIDAFLTAWQLWPTDFQE